MSIPGNPRQAGAAIRLSDADRAEAVGQLSQHYSDGRLDQAEFDERMGRAMSAKTGADLAGLFDDLPPLHKDPAPAPPGSAQPRTTRPRTTRPARAPRPGRYRWLAALLILVAAIAVTNALIHLFFSPWIWIAIALCLLVRCAPRRRYRRW